MRRKFLISIWLIGLFLISGCAPLIIGGAVGALGGYAISKDTIQGETDIDYEDLWRAAVQVVRMQGLPKYEDTVKGYIRAEVDSNKVWVRLIRLTKTATRLRISARKYHFPNRSLAEELYIKILEEAR
jgi:methenyltetrahydromethanopterin cyclohydrolase